MADHEDAGDLRFHVGLGVAVAVGLFTWQAAQGELGLAVVLAVLGPMTGVMSYGERRLRRWLMPRAERWGQDHRVERPWHRAAILAALGITLGGCLMAAVAIG